MYTIRYFKHFDSKNPVKIDKNKTIQTDNKSSIMLQQRIEAYRLMFIGWQVQTM